MTDTRSRPAISVVIPTYNRSRLLGRVLDALDAQTPITGGFEVLVVDDGSMDDTSAVVGRHPSARYLRQANAGPAAARNRGWREARAALVAFTDDDTVPSHRWLADLVAAFAADPPPDAIGGRIEPLEHTFTGDFMQLDGLVGHGVDRAGTVRYLVTANAAFRREVLDGLNGFDESFRGASGEDTDLTLRAIARGHRVVVIDRASVAHDNRSSVAELLATYRRHGSSRRAVVAANPSAGWGERRWRVVSPSQWRDRYLTYRDGGCSRRRAVAYLALRAVGLVAYGCGVVRSRVVSRRSASRARQPSPAP